MHGRFVFFTDEPTIDMPVPFARKVMVNCLAVAVAADNQVCAYQRVKFLSNTKGWQPVPQSWAGPPVCTSSGLDVAICTPLFLLTAVCNMIRISFRELENMVHGGRPLPTNPAAARPPILWAEDFVAIAGSLPLMDPQGGLKPLPESGPYVQPVSFQGATALHLAAFYGHLAVTDLLLAAGACDVTARNIQVNASKRLCSVAFGVRRTACRCLARECPCMVGHVQCLLSLLCAALLCHCLID